jgi:hypothetical protein
LNHRWATFSSQSVARSAGPRAQPTAASSCTRSGTRLSKTPTTPRAPAFGPTSRLWPPTCPRRV